LKENCSCQKIIWFLFRGKNITVKIKVRWVIMDSTRRAVLFNKSGRLFESVLCFNIFINQTETWYRIKGIIVRLCFTHSMKFSNIFFHMSRYKHMYTFLLLLLLFIATHILFRVGVENSHTHTHASTFLFYLLYLIMNWLVVD